MYSLSRSEFEAVKKCIGRVAKNSKVAAACVYGSKAAGYARPDSDIDLLLVLEQYPFAIKYAYLHENGMEVSILVLGKQALQADASSGSLGEFAVGRLLHIYEPIENEPLLRSIELTYKRRVIREVLQEIIDSASIMGTEILFPLEYIVFSKIKQRISRYPAAAYSYYKTYAASPTAAQNLQFALRGYRDALTDLVLEDPELFSQVDGLMQISAGAISVDSGKARLRFEHRIQQVSSYFVHTYAARRVMHLMFKEAESKLLRRAREKVEMPQYMLSPEKQYWRLPEGLLISSSKDWIQELADSRSWHNFKIVQKRRLGNVNSRTILYVIRQGGRDYGIVAKELARAKSVKWAALSIWTSPVKHFKVGPMFRLGTEYKALRFLRKLGIATPTIESVVLDERLLVTGFIDGDSMADVIGRSMAGKEASQLLRLAGSQIAKVHNSGASFGNIKPKNVIVDGQRLYFTDLEQFLFSNADQAWDIAQFICWDLKGTRDADAAGMIAREFLDGYSKASKDPVVIGKLAKSRRYVESFFPVLAPAVSRSIKAEIRSAAG